MWICMAPLLVGEGLCKFTNWACQKVVCKKCGASRPGTLRLPGAPAGGPPGRWWTWAAPAAPGPPPLSAFPVLAPTGARAPGLVVPPAGCAPRPAPAPRPSSRGAAPAPAAAAHPEAARVAALEAARDALQLDPALAPLAASLGVVADRARESAAEASRVAAKRREAAATRAEVDRRVSARQSAETRVAELRAGMQELFGQLATLQESLGEAMDEAEAADEPVIEATARHHDVMAELAALEAELSPPPPSVQAVEVLVDALEALVADGASADISMALRLLRATRPVVAPSAAASSDAPAAGGAAGPGPGLSGSGSGGLAAAGAPGAAAKARPSPPPGQGAPTVRSGPARAGARAFLPPEETASAPAPGGLALSILPRRSRSPRDPRPKRPRGVSAGDPADSELSGGEGDGDSGEWRAMRRQEDATQRSEISVD